jgi:hypothetical protein
MVAPPAEPARQRLARSELLFFAVFMLLLEIVTRSAVAPLASRTSPSALEELHEGLAAWPRPPVAAFLGSSHAQLAVAAHRVGDRLGLPRGAILNVGTSAGGPREQLQVYRANRALLGRARVVFLEVGARDFNRHRAIRETHGPDAWRRTAGLAERVGYPVDVRTKADWVAGWLLATWDLRATWRSLIQAAWLKARAAAGARHVEVFDADGRAAVVRDPAAITAEWLAATARSAASRHLQVYELDREALDALGELVRDVRADGARVLFVEYPVSDAYLETVAREHAAADRVWRQELGARFPDVPRLRFEAGAARLGVEDFRDADHLSRRGARAFAPYLAERVRPLLPGASPI